MNVTELARLLRNQGITQTLDEAKAIAKRLIESGEADELAAVVKELKALKEAYQEHHHDHAKRKKQVRALQKQLASHTRRGKNAAFIVKKAQELQ